MRRRVQLGDLVRRGGRGRRRRIGPDVGRDEEKRHEQGERGHGALHERRTL
jgi:hypothetical protein